MRTYDELMRLDTFQERFDYLRLKGRVGSPTLDEHRHLVQTFYRSDIWMQTRERIIARDWGCDLAHEDYEIRGMIIIHHINPITVDDLLNHTNNLTDPNNLICVSDRTHRSIHYGEDIFLPEHIIERKPNDTIPWKG